MSEATRIDRFGEALRTAVANFKREEGIIRATYGQGAAAGNLPIGVDIENMLERPTRRFLIDPMLRALDWNPDDPHQVTEEARSWAENGDRLYFDYLGRNSRQAPTLLVEAKGSDAQAARAPREPDLSGSKMAVKISEALATVKAGSHSSAVLVQWVEWLTDLRTYVRSLEPVYRMTLRRVVITAGRWMIIFADPVAAFVDEGAPDTNGIHCYTSFDEIVECHTEIYRLLARRQLTDTIPLTMKLGEALKVLDPSALTGVYRGVVVATRISGGVRGEYPTRAVYPAIVLISGDRAFAAVDYAAPVEEPRDARGFASFLADLANKGSAFENSVLTMFGRADVAPLPLSQYPFTVREPDIADAFAPEPDSTAAMSPTPLRPQLVRQTGERHSENEYLVITGQGWFYKDESPRGSSCDFHSYPNARNRGVAAPMGHFDRAAKTFTISGDPQHCEHDHLHGMRSARCQLDNVESHLCCRACIFHDICWEANDLPRLPCAP